MWNLIDDYTGDRFVKFRYNKVFDLNQLKLDQHFFTVSTNNESIPQVNLSEIYLYTLHKDCIECPYTFTDKSVINITQSGKLFRLATNFEEYYPENRLDNVICDLDPHFGQFGVYNIVVDNLTHCHVEILKEPVNIYWPILTVLLLHIAVFGSLFVLIKLWNKYKKSHERKNNDKENDPKSAKERIRSIDTFRGMCIVVMIFANFGSGGYRSFEHATWNGIHIADLIFPWFMWIMGMCVPITLFSCFKRNIPNSDLLLQVLKRSVKLFCLGIFLSSGTNLLYLRIFGVLQRFGVCYFIITTICVFTLNRPNNNNDSNQRKFILKHLADLFKVWKCWIICILLVIIHTVIIFTISAPGCPKGYMGPGGLHKNRSFINCIGGATGYLDSLIFRNHIYQNPTIYEIFEAKPFDPEGLIGCLTSVFHVMLGVQAGIILLTFKKHSERIIRWLIWSLLLGLLGGVLCGFSKENGLIPVNKNLWSLSFVLVTCSLAFFVLTIFYVLVDFTKIWTGKPFLFAGMNSILLYIGHEITSNNFPVRWYYSTEDIDDNWRRTHFISLLSDTWAADFWILISYYLYKIRYFFTV